MNGDQDYHSALWAESDAPHCQRVELKNGVAFQHDITAGLPDEFRSCDVIYSEPPWPKGFQTFNERTGGLLPIVVLDKPLNDRMASTVRHNRARGKHSVSGMGNMVFQMLEGGWSDEDICKEIGLSVDELVRLKHITGFSKLFENVEYQKAWEGVKQIQARKKWEQEHEGKDH